MPKIVRTPAARSDISNIAQTIAGDNLGAALRVVDEIDKVISHIGQFPELGQSVENLRPGLRRTSRSPYAIYYRILGDVVEIDRVIHGARDIGRVYD